MTFIEKCHKICMYIKYVDYNFSSDSDIFNIFHSIFSACLPPQSGGPSCRALTSSESNCRRVKVEDGPVKVEDGSHPYSKLPNMAALVVGN